MHGVHRFCVGFILSLSPTLLLAGNDSSTLSLCHTDYSQNIDAPSSIFNLSKWKLTLPISKSTCFAFDSTVSNPENAAEIYPSSQRDNNLDTVVKPLDQGFLFHIDNTPDDLKHDDYFFLDQGSMVFRTPLKNFVTTGGSSNPRTELRELYTGPDAFKDSWPLTGEHLLKGSFQVTVFESSDQRTEKTVFAQIHGLGDDINPMVKMVWRKLNNDPNDRSGEVYALVKDQPDDTDTDKDLKLKFGTVQTGQDIDFEIRTKGQTLILVVNGQTESIKTGNTRQQDDGSSWTFSTDWASHHLYFKAGNYAQLYKPKEGEDPLDQADTDYIEVQYTSLEIDPKPALTPIIDLLLADDEAQSYISPYTLSKFQPVIDQSRLQIRRPGQADQDIRLNTHHDYASMYFYLDSNQYMTFHAEGTVTPNDNDIRSEFRQDSLWSTADSAGKKMIGWLKLEEATAGFDEYTWMQIHDKNSTGNPSPNKPLVRLIWLRAQEGQDKHRIGAVVKQDATGDGTLDTEIDLGEMPDGFFKAELKVQNNLLKIKINDIDMTDGGIDVSFWEQYDNYFKAGSYFNDSGAATVKFDSLKYYDSY